MSECRAAGTDSNLHPRTKKMEETWQLPLKGSPASRSRSAAIEITFETESSPSRPTARSSSAPGTRWCSRRRRAGWRRAKAQTSSRSPSTSRAHVRNREDPGGFFKRKDDRPSARSHRTHDRPPDPAALAEGLQGEVQVICTVLSADMVIGRHPLHQRRVGGADARPCRFSARSGPCESARSRAGSSSTRRCGKRRKSRRST